MTCLYFSNLTSADGFVFPITVHPLCFVVLLSVPSFVYVRGSLCGARSRVWADVIRSIGLPSWATAYPAAAARHFCWAISSDFGVSLERK